MVLKRYNLRTSLVSTAGAVAILSTGAHAGVVGYTDKKRELIGPVIQAARVLAISSRNTQRGVASWYGGRWIGRKTANGERYHQDDLTAAHRTLPFGTYVRVTNLRNNKSTVVRINNRGPYIKGRIIDVSKRAAASLGLINSGIARVQVEVLPTEAAKAEIASL
jgi:rare lipoprotein A